MATLFQDSNWLTAIKKLDLSRVMGLKTKAMQIIGNTPQRVTDEDLERIAPELNIIREKIAYARDNSDLPDFWPSAECNDIELLLWLSGLNRYLLLPTPRRR